MHYVVLEQSIARAKCGFFECPKRGQTHGADLKNKRPFGENAGHRLGPKLAQKGGPQMGTALLFLVEGGPISGP
jgi:hypothetical protein